MKKKLSKIRENRIKEIPFYFFLATFLMIKNVVYSQEQNLDLDPSMDASTSENIEKVEIRDPFNSMVQQVNIPIYALQNNQGQNPIFNDLIKIKVLVLGSSSSGKKVAYLELPQGEIIMVKEQDYFSIQGSDYKITPVHVKEITDTRMLVVIDQRSKFILR